MSQRPTVFWGLLLIGAFFSRETLHPHPQFLLVVSSPYGDPSPPSPSHPLTFSPTLSPAWLPPDHVEPGVGGKREQEGERRMTIELIATTLGQVDPPPGGGWDSNSKFTSGELLS